MGGGCGEISSFAAEVFKKPCQSKIRRPLTDAEETKPKAELLMSLLVRASEVQSIELGFFLLEK